MNWRRNYDLETRKEERLSWLNVQLVMITEDTGCYQEKGKPVQIVHKGDMIKCALGVAHWHGAAPESTFAYIAVWPTQKGETKWLQRVSDQEYRSADPKHSKKENDKQQAVGLVAKPLKIRGAAA